MHQFLAGSLAQVKVRTFGGSSSDFSKTYKERSSYTWIAVTLRNFLIFF